jgi:hypothetical protein
MWRFFVQRLKSGQSRHLLWRATEPGRPAANSGGETMHWILLLAAQGGGLDGALKVAGRGAISGPIGGALVGLVFAIARLFKKKNDNDGEE